MRNGRRELQRPHRIQNCVQTIRALLHVRELLQETRAQLRLALETRIHLLQSFSLFRNSSNSAISAFSNSSCDGVDFKAFIKIMTSSYWNAAAGFLPNQQPATVRAIDCQ